MTAPVSLQPAEGQWVVSFMMPASYSLETLPIPLMTMNLFYVGSQPAVWLQFGILVPGVGKNIYVTKGCWRPGFKKRG